MPHELFPDDRAEPTVAFTVLVTVHVTFGTFLGTRPSTSRSKSSTISGRRCFHHIAGVVTFLPFFSVRTSGRIRIRIGRGLVVIGMIGRGLVAAGARTERLDAELIHHVLTVLGRGPISGLRKDWRLLTEQASGPANPPRRGTNSRRPLQSSYSS